jgi:hypothetical protein
MSISIRLRQTTDSQLFRWCGRASGAVMVAIWLSIFVAELLRQGVVPSSATYLQAAALVIVFGGYAIGWLNEQIGGWMAILGTAAFFIVCKVSMTYYPPPEAALFAFPGVNYVLAHYFDGVEKSRARQS